MSVKVSMSHFPGLSSRENNNHPLHRVVNPFEGLLSSIRRKMPGDSIPSNDAVRPPASQGAVITRVSDTS